MEPPSLARPIWRATSGVVTFLVWWKLWITFGVVIFLLALLAFLVWWREKIIEPDNERLRMGVRRAIRRSQEGTPSRSSDGGF